MTIEPGKSETVTFAKPGKIRVSDAAQGGSALKLLIVPNAHFAEVTNGVFQLDTVPPGAYVLHVVAENPRVRPTDREVIVGAGTTAAVDVPLARR